MDSTQRLRTLSFLLFVVGSLITLVGAIFLNELEMVFNTRGILLIILYAFGAACFGAGMGLAFGLATRSGTHNDYN